MQKSVPQCKLPEFVTAKVREKKTRENMKEKNENKFTQYALSEEILDALEILGYKEPTQIQTEVIPLILRGESLTAKSQTGSGKTAAFAIPLCEGVDWEENMPQALVLEPTRELTVQVKQEIFQIGRKKRLKVPDVFGGFPIDKQIQTLKQKSHIVVGTPGRVADHIRRGSLKLENIRYLVIDEADLMLDMGFAQDVTWIIEQLPADRQMMLFSATLNPKVTELIETHMGQAVDITVESEHETVETVEQRCYRVLSQEKYEVFLTLLMKENPESCMVFCGTREMVDVLGRRMKKDGLRCGMLHGEIDQQTRLRTIEGFKENRFRFLIATDVAARGVDVQNLSHVFNYDFPTGCETYVHRLGRTGRCGQDGIAISLVSETDEVMAGRVEAYIGCRLPFEELPVKSQVEEMFGAAFWKRQKERPVLKAGKGAGFKKTITRLSIGGGKKSKMRTADIVGTICSIEGIEATDIGVIDIRDSLTYVEILNGKGKLVLDELQEKTIKGKVRKVRITR